MKAMRPGFAIAAVFPAAMVPIALPALRALGAADMVQGCVVGMLLGVSVLLLALALRPIET